MKSLLKNIPFITLFAAFHPLLQSMELPFEEKSALIDAGSADVLEIDLLLKDRSKAELPRTLVPQDNPKDELHFISRVSYGFNFFLDTYELRNGERVSTLTTIGGKLLYKWFH